MKKQSYLILIFGLLLVSFKAKSQNTVQNINELPSIDYMVGQGVFMGNYNGQNVYRASFTGKLKYTTKKSRCRKGVGCCKTGTVDYYESGQIIIFNSYNGGGQCGSNGEPISGQMYYSSEETWIEN